MIGSFSGGRVKWFPKTVQLVKLRTGKEREK